MSDEHKKPPRTKFSHVDNVLNESDKAVIMAKIIFKNDKSEGRQAQIELSFESRHSEAREIIPIPTSVSVAGGEALLEYTERLNQVFMSDLNAVKSAVEHYHYAKTGNKGGKETNIRNKNALTKLYTKMVKDIFTQYAEGLTRAQHAKTVEEFTADMDGLIGGQRAHLIQAIRDVIRDDEISYPYQFDAMEKDLSDYDLGFRKALDVINEHVIEGHVSRSDSDFDKDNEQFVKAKKDVDDAVCAFEEAWLHIAVEIRRQGYVAMQDSAEQAETVKQTVKSAQSEVAALKKRMSYQLDMEDIGSEKTGEAVLADAFEEIETFLDDMTERSKVLADSVRMRDILVGNTSKSARER